MSVLGSIRTRLFGISLQEASFERRGFHTHSAQARQHLEHLGRTFITGYNTALACDDAEALAPRLDDAPLELRGFAFEGAAMALALLDELTPWRRDRFDTLLHGPGRPHVYMLHVGCGWALARLKRTLEPRLARMDPLLRWLVVDGVAFHEAYFHPDRYLDGQRPTLALHGYAARAFDQGLGRCLWFIHGAGVEAITATVARCDQSRRGDLWSGVGLACTYAGGVDDASIDALRDAAGEYQPQLAQGAAFATKARQLAGNLTPHTQMACRLLCGASAQDAANLTDEALVGLPDDRKDEPAFEVWRRRIAQRVAAEPVAAETG